MVAPSLVCHGGPGLIDDKVGRDTILHVVLKRIVDTDRYIVICSITTSISPSDMLVVDQYTTSTFASGPFFAIIPVSFSLVAFL